MGKMNYDNHKEDEIRDNIKVDIDPIKIFAREQEEIFKKMDQTNCKYLQDEDIETLLDGFGLAYDYIITLDVRPREISDIIRHFAKCMDKLLDEKRRRENNKTVVQLSKKQKARSSKLAAEEAELTKDLKEAREKKKEKDAKKKTEEKKDTKKEEKKTKEKKINSAEDFIKQQKEERKKTTMQKTETEEKEEEIHEWRKTTVPDFILPDTPYNRELQKIYEKKFYA